MYAQCKDSVFFYGNPKNPPKSKMSTLENLSNKSIKEHVGCTGKSFLRCFLKHLGHY